jgi:hypothetical protein
MAVEQMPLNDLVLIPVAVSGHFPAIDIQHLQGSAVQSATAKKIEVLEKGIDYLP